MQVKRCSKCDLLKDLKEFAVRKRSKDGYQVWCKKCMKGYRTTPKARASRKAYDTAYNRSDRHKAACKSYCESERGKAVVKEYNRSPEWKAYDKKRNPTEKRRATFRKSSRKYRASSKRKVVLQRYDQSERGKICRRLKGVRRRIRKVDVFMEKVSEKEIYLRDGGICQICKKRVSNKLRYPHPMSLSLDHIIPLAKSGTHESRNIQLVHLRCNLSKGDRAANDQLRMC